MNSPIEDREKGTTDVFEAILRLENIDQCRSLFQVLLTDAELERIPVRWAIVQMLSEGALTNKQIAARVGVSPTTVSAVNARLKRSGAPLKPLLERLSRQRNTSGIV